MDDFTAQLQRIRANIEAKQANSNQLAESGRDLRKNTVTKSNALCRAYYRFGLVEKRCMETLISKLHPLRTDNDLQHVTLKAKDYARVFSIPENIAYRDIASAVDTLMHRVIWADRPSGKPGKIQYTLMSSAEYKDDEGQIECAFNPQIVPHLIGLREKFAQYPLEKAAAFSSSYTWRLYELLVSWAQDPKDTGRVLVGWLSVEVDELRKMLGVPDSYTWHKFQARVLDVAAQELEEKAGVGLRITRQKTGRRISHLKLEFMGEQQVGKITAE